ncbi:MAG TPA: glycoside hydrolase family 43 protein [Thermoleophilaceae bacterium]
MCAPAAPANPVVGGDHPDPSILRTAGGWYATSTSDDWVPAFPVLRSRDLVHWRQAGAVLARRPGWARNDFWAPELVRRDGRFLAYYAALAKSGRRCVAGASAGRIAGPYHDHGPIVCSRTGEIDPLPVLDEQRAAWLLWKRDGNSRGRVTPILAAPLAPGGMSLAAPPRELFRASARWERHNVEAPALLRHGGYVYLFYSAGHCCGRNCTYATGVARASTLLGPWEKRRRPILRGGGAIRCPGHVGVTRAGGGEPLLAYHAYIRGDPSNRQLFMTRVRFGVDGWPTVSTYPKRVQTRFRGSAWQWPAGPRPAFAASGAGIVLRDGTVAKQTGTTRFSAGTAVPIADRGARPGLAVTGSEGNAVGVELRGARAVAWSSVNGRRRISGRLRLPPGRPVAESARVRLRVAVGHRVTTAIRFRGRWRTVGRPQPPPRWASGARVALSARGRLERAARFERVTIRPR